MKTDSESALKSQIAQRMTQSGAVRKGREQNKLALTALALATGVMITGCASNQSKVALDVVGPAPACATAINTANGSLVVYSECQADVNTGTPFASDSLGSGETTGYTWEYSSYKILSADGKVLKYVDNNEGTTVLHPQQISLPTGKYFVVARANEYGRVTVPVAIDSNQVTVLHLGSDGFWPRETGFNQTNAVHLPNGQIIGWRALSENTITQ